MFEEVGVGGHRRIDTSIARPPSPRPALVCRVARDAPQRGSPVTHPAESEDGPE